MVDNNKDLKVNLAAETQQKPSKLVSKAKRLKIMKKMLTQKDEISKLIDELEKDQNKNPANLDQMADNNKDLKVNLAAEAQQKPNKLVSKAKRLRIMKTLIVKKDEISKLIDELEENQNKNPTSLYQVAINNNA